MARKKRKLSAAENADKKRRGEEYMTIFVRGKQKRVKRPPTIEGLSVDEFILRNADPIWLHQNEMWEDMDVDGEDSQDDCDITDERPSRFIHAGKGPDPTNSSN